MTKARLQGWRNRIVQHGEKPASDFLASHLNWRIHPKAQRDALAGVLDSVGWVQDVIESANSGELLDGHLRVSLALSRGDETPVPYVRVDVTEGEEALILASLDPLSAMAVADKGKLDELLRQVDVGDAAVQQMLAELAAEAGLDWGKPEVPEDVGAQLDRAEELREQWQTGPGQLWEIPSKTVPGKCHRLLCGDSTSAEDVARLMGGERANLLVADPPYNVGIEYGESTDDGKDLAEYRTFSESWFTLWQSISDRQIVTPGGVNHVQWARWFDSRHVGVWIKTNALTRGRVSNSWCWEPMFFFGGRWPKSRANDVFDYPIGQQADTANHPCPKPLRLWVDLLEHYSTPGDVVVDPFDGSGTTIVAAEQTGRVAYCVELEPKYVAVALERMQGLGLTPQLLQD